jgi:hypothetical protein
VADSRVDSGDGGAAGDDDVLNVAAEHVKQVGVVTGRSS